MKQNKRIQENEHHIQNMNIKKIKYLIPKYLEPICIFKPCHASEISRLFSMENIVLGTKIFRKSDATKISLFPLLSYSLKIPLKIVSTEPKKNQLHHIQIPQATHRIIKL